MTITFDDIPKFPRPSYEVDVSWRYIERQIERMGEGPGGLDLDPDFQRAHVWTQNQQREFVEYQLMGGEVSRDITFNGPDFRRGGKAPVVLLDGKQRLEAVRSFLRNELTVFGQTCKDFGRLPWMDYRFRFVVCELQSREEVLSLYLKINAGGTPHSSEELTRVRRMLEASRHER